MTKNEEQAPSAWEFIDIFSPKGVRKIRIFKKANNTIRIQSNFLKRLELEHIEDQIENMKSIPDFGYDVVMEE